MVGGGLELRMRMPHYAVSPLGLLVPGDSCLSPERTYVFWF